MALDHIAVEYDKLKPYLKQWEDLAVQYRRISQTASTELMRHTAERMKQARKEFLRVRKSWLDTIRQNLILVNLSPSLSYS